MELNKRHIVLGVTGGIAAYKAAELVRELQRAGASVQVVMTRAATHFVTPVTFQALSARPVFVDQWDDRVANNMAHIELSRSADAILIAPASADFIGKLANGLCDDLLGTMCVARECPLVVAPAMNRQMWTNPALQRNVAQLRADGVTLFGPDSGDQACGEVGPGRMLEPPAIVEELVAFFAPRLLAGRRVVVTAGPTYEPIDPVRGITNRSSGKMGFAVARACRQAGAEVRLVAGPTTLPTPAGVTRTDVQTAREMCDAALDACAPGCDLFIAVAAVADWQVTNASARKIKKDEIGTTPELAFAENPDILRTVAGLPNAPYCVGFAAESEDLARNGEQKRRRKGVPLLVANIGHETFGRDDNELLLIDEHGMKPLARAGKDELARALVAEIASRLGRPATGSGQ